MVSKQMMNVNSVSRNKAFGKAFDQYIAYSPMLKRDNIIVIIDYTQPSYRKRLYVYEFKEAEGVVEWVNTRNHHVAHGSGSSKGGDLAYADKFGNSSNSHMSSLGAMVTDNTYHGKHGFSLRINGLESKNSNVRNRCIVFHPADYVTDQYIIQKGRAGQSHGCPALDPSISNSLIQLIKGGVFIYAHY